MARDQGVKIAWVLGINGGERSSYVLLFFFFSCSIQPVTVAWAESDEKIFGGKWLNLATKEGWLKSYSSGALIVFSSSTCTRQQHYTYLLLFFFSPPLRLCTYIYMFITIKTKLKQGKYGSHNTQNKWAIGNHHEHLMLLFPHTCCPFFSQHPLLHFFFFSDRFAPCPNFFSSWLHLKLHVCSFHKGTKRQNHACLLNRI